MQIGELSKLDWLVELVKHAIWTNSLYSLHLLLLSFCRILASFQERGPLSLLSTTEELLERKSIDSGLENRAYGRDSSETPSCCIDSQYVWTSLKRPSQRAQRISDSQWNLGDNHFAEDHISGYYAIYALVSSTWCVASLSISDVIMIVQVGRGEQTLRKGFHFRESIFVAHSEESNFQKHDEFRVLITLSVLCMTASVV
jgi:hypothetical protein